MKFLLVIGNTKVANINGITIAGQSPELVKYTPVADAEFLFHRLPRSINQIPVSPQGHPTPAIITKAINRILKVPTFVVRSGSMEAPKVPFVQISSMVGGDITLEDGVPNCNEIEEYAKIFAKNFQDEESIIIGESIPGGTTTAMAVLNSMGHDFISSSSSEINPIEIKRGTVEKALKRINFNRSTRLDRKAIAMHFGDPVLCFISNFIDYYDGKIILAGGTQMLAAYALSNGNENLEIWTTKYVAEDKTATFKQTAKELGVKYKISEVNLSKSKFQGLRDYERGVVKEGVGAGAFMVLAEKSGLSNETIVNSIDEIYEDLISNS